MMMRLYEAEIFSFDNDVESCKMTYGEAAECVRDGHAAAILLDIVEPNELDKWWYDEAFPDMVQHKNFTWAKSSGLSIGPTQRLEKEHLISGLMNYVSYASKVNDQLKLTEFVKLGVRELGATPVGLGEFAEFPLASKREFSANPNSHFSVAPHCDVIHFGRETHDWPVKESFSEGYDQLSIFLTVQEAQNRAGIILWELRPESRSELDALMAEFASHQRIERLRGRRSLAVRARAGQMTILNTCYLHAVERCTSVRQTIGTFLVWHAGRWRMFQ